MFHYCIRPMIDSNQNSDAKRNPHVANGGRGPAAQPEKYLNDYL